MSKKEIIIKLLDTATEEQISIVYSFISAFLMKRNSKDMNESQILSYRS